IGIAAPRIFQHPGALGRHAANSSKQSSREDDLEKFRKIDIYPAGTASAKRDSATARHSLTVMISAAGVNGLRRHRVAPGSSAIRRKSGAGELTLAKA